MYQKCITDAKSSAQGLGSGSWMCRKCGLYRRSRAQGPETLPCAKTSRAQGVPNRNQIGTQLGGRRRSPPVDSLNGLNSLLPLLEPSSETLFGNKLKNKRNTQLYKNNTQQTHDEHPQIQNTETVVCACVVCCPLVFFVFTNNKINHTKIPQQSTLIAIYWIFIIASLLLNIYYRIFTIEHVLLNLYYWMFTIESLLLNLYYWIFTVESLLWNLH